jgi:hypothetical protein
MKVNDNDKNTNVGWFFWEVQGWSFKIDIKNSISSLKQNSSWKNLGNISKILKKTFKPVFKVLVLTHFIPTSFQVWFSHAN